MKDKYIKKERVSELTKKIIKLSDHLYPQTDEDIRKQIYISITDEYRKKCKQESWDGLCVNKSCEGCWEEYLINKLIEARKTIAAKKE